MIPAQKPVYRFAEFTLDVKERQLHHGSQEVLLQPKVFDTLLFLIERHGHLVKKDELLEKLWADTFVTENALTRCIKELREVLQDDAHQPRYIRTIPRVGYKFIAEVESWQRTPRESSETARYFDKAESAAEQTSVSRHNSNLPRGQNAPLAAASEGPHLTADKLHRLSAKKILHSVAILIVVTGVAVTYYKIFIENQSRPAPTEPFQKIQMSSIPTSGKARDAAISPDGRYIAYVMDEAGRQSLWLRSANTSGGIRIVSPGEVEYFGLTFSNDSKYIYYVALGKNKAAAVLYQLPIPGGAPRELLQGGDSAISFSPDGRQFAFVSLYASRGESYLLIANSDGTEQRKLTIRRQPLFYSMFPSAPAWSPDGKIIASAAGRSGSRYRDMDVVAVQLADGVEKRISANTWYDLGRIVWVADGSGVVISARDHLRRPARSGFFLILGVSREKSLTT